MCYGTCYFEEYMGECNSTLVYERDEIVNCEEDDEYFKWLSKIGVVEIKRNQIYDYLES